MNNNQHIQAEQKVAILFDGNNIERSIHKLMQSKNAMLNFDYLVPKLLNGRSLNRFVYFKEGDDVSEKLRKRVQMNFSGSLVPCKKSADIPICMAAVQLVPKVDTIIVVSGDSDFLPLVSYLKANGLRVECAGLEHSSSFNLIASVDYFYKITPADCFVFEKHKTFSQ